MNKTILLIVGGIVIVGVGVFAFTQFSLPVGDVEIGGDTLEDFTGSLDDLFGLGRNLTCTFERADEFGTMTGTVYVAGENVRADFNVVRPSGEEFDTHTITDDNWIYTWGMGPFGELGTKIRVSNVDDVEQTGEQQGGTPNLDEEVSYKCSSWSVDGGMFNPPSDVEFQDLTASVQQIQNQAQDIPQVDCSLCDSVPAGEAREQCRQSLGC